MLITGLDVNKQDLASRVGFAEIVIGSDSYYQFLSIDLMAGLLSRLYPLA